MIWWYDRKKSKCKISIPFIIYPFYLFLCLWDENEKKCCVFMRIPFHAISFLASKLTSWLFWIYHTWKYNWDFYIAANERVITPDWNLAHKTVKLVATIVPITLLWVSGHQNILRIEEADQPLYVSICRSVNHIKSAQWRLVVPGF